mmetsp:Transcript_17477/g.37770  ORF Transcript_17477/g.37770 Transcript_17477/m.37770 type:complete len:225 (+) Transcript_17477:159-833(+)
MPLPLAHRTAAPSSWRPATVTPSCAACCWTSRCALHAPWPRTAPPSASLPARATSPPLSCWRPPSSCACGSRGLRTWARSGGRGQGPRHWCGTPWSSVPVCCTLPPPPRKGPWVVRAARTRVCAAWLGWPRGRSGRSCCSRPSPSPRSCAFRRVPASTRYRGGTDDHRKCMLALVYTSAAAAAAAGLVWPPQSRTWGRTMCAGCTTTATTSAHGVVRDGTRHPG